MKTQAGLFDFILKQWLLLLSASGLVFTSVYLNQIPSWSITELKVLFILFAFFVAVKGVENSGLMLRISRRLEMGGFIPLKLVLATFFSSMFLTNDAALIVIVPLTLSLRTKRKDIIVILEALAANAGSALTPFGNPQNLFIYWIYKLDPEKFILTIAPFSFVFMVLLIIFSIMIRSGKEQKSARSTGRVRYFSYIYLSLLVIVILSALHVLPASAGIVVVIYALLMDRKSLRIDYSLLLCFFCFLGLATNIKTLLAPAIESSGHVFLLSSMTSQVMSNVPTALLFARFTTQWKALLWGVSVGGFGSLFGSFANLIAYKLYLDHEDTDNSMQFTIQFLLFGYLAFFIGIGLYYI
ncbi:MAG: hypothetical protein DRH32_04825 [Deltaproteobacteria bacterium]|nr:MAG: hypothetical protein DRH32_04825 [Deltaproteobacteria bacterium]